MDPSLSIFISNPTLAMHPWAPLYDTLHPKILPHQPPLLNTAPTNDFLVLSSKATVVPEKLAFICLSNAFGTGTTLTNETHRIFRCLQLYGSHRTTILLLTPSEHSSCLQALQYFLLRDIVSEHPTAPKTYPVASDSLSMIDMPNIVLCRSGKDAADYVSLLLETLKTAKSTTLTLPQSSGLSVQRDLNNETLQTQKTYHLGHNTSPTWIASATSQGQCSLVTDRDYRQLRMGLSTLQNISSASSGQLRNRCLLNGPSATAIESFFDTDRPI